MTRLGPRVATDRDDHAREHGPDDAAEVVLRRGERDRARQVFDRHEVGEDRLERGEAEARADPVGERDQRQDRRRRVTDDEQGREECRQSGLHERRAHEQELAGQAVGERAADRTEERDRDEPRSRDGAGPGGLARVVGHVDAERERLHPRADVGDESAGPEAGVGRVAEWGDRVEPARDRGTRQRFRHCGARFSKNASIPSWASSARALATIAGAGDVVRGRLRQLVLRVERPLAQREHERARRGDALGQGHDLGLEPRFGHHAVDEPPVERGRRVDHLSGEEHLERALAADGRRDGHHRRRAEESDIDAGCGEPGGVGRDREVARGDELAARRGRDPVDLGDHRLRELVYPRHQAYARGEEPFVERLVTIARHLREVVTGRERRSAAFDHEHAGGRVGRDGVEQVEHLFHRREGERVAALGPVEYEPRDRAVALELDLAPDVRHRARLTGYSGCGFS